LLSLCGAIDNLRAFLIIPVTENDPSTGTDDVETIGKNEGIMRL